MPSALAAVPSVLLAAVLLLSSVAKIRDPRDTSSVFRQLDLPAFLLRLRAPRLLPYGELLLVAALLLTPGRWYLLATSAALVLFAGYFVVILRALRLPYPVTCPCFGRLGLGQVTRGTLVRNGVLVAVALVAWADAWRGDGVAERVGHPAALAGGLGALAVAGVGMVLAVLQRRGPASSLLDTDPLDYERRPVPPGVLLGPDGPVSVWTLTDTGSRLLVFCDPERDPEVASAARVWAARIAPVRVHVVNETGDDLRDPDGVFRRALGVASPGAVLLGADRMLAGGPVDGLEEMTELVEAIVAELGTSDSAHL